jgi:uracil-DNA glycosylase
MKLREALHQFLSDWQDDLVTEWRDVLSGVGPDFNAVDQALTFDDEHPIFPGRKGHLLPGAPANSHVFHALDGISPSDVRAVIIGQDPYPKISQATGRSFEQGDLEDWPANQKVIADSLQRIVQVLLVERVGNEAYGGADASWARVTADLASGELILEKPHALFDRLQSRGVIFLNAGLTITRFKPGGAPEQKFGHIPLWQPVIHAILRHLATRNQGSVVFLLWGAFARNVFERGEVQQAAQQAHTWGVRATVVEHAHPNAQPQGKPFYAPPNPFTEANRKLRQMGGTTIQW